MPIYVNVKPFYPATSFPDEKHAIGHAIEHKRRWCVWNGARMNNNRGLAKALMNKDISAFKAMPRKGHWRVEFIGDSE